MGFDPMLLLTMSRAFEKPRGKIVQIFLFIGVQILIKELFCSSSIKNI